MKRLLIFLLMGLTASISAVAQGRLAVDVTAHYSNKRLTVGTTQRLKDFRIVGVHLYHIRTNGEVEYLGQTDEGGRLAEPIEIPKVGYYTIRYLLHDNARFVRGDEETHTKNHWEIYDSKGGSISDTLMLQKSDTELQDTRNNWRQATLAEVESGSLVEVGEITINCAKVRGNRYDVDIHLKERDAMDVMYIASMTTREARINGRKKARSGVGALGTDGVREGDYENFSVRFKVPKGRMKSHYRIVAQPVWIDKKLDLEYYGDPVTFYNRKYYYTKLRESGFELLDKQSGLLFYDSVPRKKTDAYTQDFGPADDPLAHYSLTEREELHRLRQSQELDYENYHFRVPFYIKVNEDMMSNDCVALVKWVMTDYDHILEEHCDTIISGRSDPLRFLKYNVGGFMDKSNRNHAANRYWFPETGEGLHNDTTNLRLFYEQGKTDLDFSKPQNAHEVTKVDSISKLVLESGADILNVEILGYASPEGGIELNRRLSAARAQKFGDYIRTRLPKLSPYIHPNSDIASWTMVADTLRRWGKMGGLVGEPATKDEVYREVQDAEVLNRALDAVRVTKFRIDYEIRKPYTPRELSEMYGTEKFNRPYMYRDLYRYLTDESQGQKDWKMAERVCQEKYNIVARRHARSLQTLRELADKPILAPEDTLPLKQALMDAHEVLLYANDLCAMKLHRSVGDTTLLYGFINRHISIDYQNPAYSNEKVGPLPGIVYLNQASAYLLHRRFSMARGLMDYYQNNYNPDQREVNDLNTTLTDLITINASPSNITPECVERLAKIDPINRVVCVLAMPDATTEQLAEIRHIAVTQTADSVANNNMIRALCYGHEFIFRSDSYQVEEKDLYDPDLRRGASYLRTALIQDPSLSEMAYTQRDLKPLFKVIDRMKKDEETLMSIRIKRRNSAKGK